MLVGNRFQLSLAAGCDEGEGCVAVGVWSWSAVAKSSSSCSDLAKASSAAVRPICLRTNKTSCNLSHQTACGCEVLGVWWGVVHNSQVLTVTILPLAASVQVLIQLRRSCQCLICNTHLDNKRLEGDLQTVKLTGVRCWGLGKRCTTGRSIQSFKALSAPCQHACVACITVRREISSSDS